MFQRYFVITEKDGNFVYNSLKIENGGDKTLPIPVELLKRILGVFELFTVETRPNCYGIAAMAHFHGNDSGNNVFIFSWGNRDYGGLRPFLSTSFDKVLSYWSSEKLKSWIEEEYKKYFSKGELTHEKGVNAFYGTHQ